MNLNVSTFLRLGTGKWVWVIANGVLTYCIGDIYAGKLLNTFYSPCIFSQME